MIDSKTKQVICIAIGKGRRHDLDLLRVSQTRFASQMLVKADKGYQGIKKLHTNSETPHKKPYRGKLTREQRAENRKLARERIVVEHVNRRFKRPCPSAAVLKVKFQPPPKSYPPKASDPEQSHSARSATSAYTPPTPPSLPSQHPPGGHTPLSRLGCTELLLEHT